MRFQLGWVIGIPIFFKFVYASTEIEEIANEIVSQSQSDLDKDEIWERIDGLQKDFPLHDMKGSIVETKKETASSFDNDLAGRNSLRSKLALFPLKKETIETMFPNLALDIAESFTKYGFFYMDIWENKEN